MIEHHIIQLLKQTFQLDWQGVHGVPHWARVRINGLLIAQQNGANQRVVELFAFFHDIKRLEDFGDPLHGERAAEFLMRLPDQQLGINAEEKTLLCYACKDHSKGLTEAELTVSTCWDADRLDLGRGGPRPNPKKLCTDIARQDDFIEQAFQRSRNQHRRKASHANAPGLVRIWSPAEDIKQ